MDRAHSLQKDSFVDTLVVSKGLSSGTVTSGTVTVGGIEVLARLKQYEYEILILKHSRNSLRIAEALSKSYVAEQIKQLTKTSWTEGKVIYAFESTAGSSITDIIVRWKRSWMDIEYDHELSTMDAAVDVTGTPITSVSGTVTQGPPTGVLDPNGDPTYEWIFTPAPDTRYMQNGGDFYPGVTRLIAPRSLNGSIPLSADLGASPLPAEFFTQDNLFNGTKSEARVWQYTGSRPYTEYIGSQLSWISPQLEEPTPLSTSKIVHIERQEASESDLAFYARVFGTEATNFLTELNTKEETLNYDGNENAINLDDARLFAFLTSCGYTRVNGASSDSSLEPVDTPACSISVKEGRLLLGGEILRAGDSGGLAPSEEIYSLWADPNSVQLDDAVMVSLPSNVIHSGSIADITNYGTPSRPHARIPVADNVREYDYVNDPKCLYLNFVRVKSNTVSKGFGGSNSPGSALWFFWRPGYSIWVYGTTNRSNKDVEIEYIENSNPSGSGDFNFPARSIEWAAMHLLGNIPVDTTIGASFNDYSSRIPQSAESELYRPINYLASLQDNSIIVNHLPDNAGVPVDPITLFAGPSLPNGSGGFRDRALFAALNGTVDGDLTGNDIALTAPPQNVDVKPPYLYPYNANFRRFLTTNFVSEHDFDIPTTIPKYTLTRNPTDTSNIDLNDISTYLGRFDYGSFLYKDFTLNGQLSSLFPPLWYLQTSQGYTPEIRNLTQRLNYMEQFVNDYIEVAIESTLTSISKLGIVNELIARKIIFLENEIKIRYDQLVTYIDTAIGSLVDLIKETEKTAFQTFAEGGTANAFLAGFLLTVPVILGLIPVVGPAASKIASFAVDTHQSNFRAAVIAETASRLLSTASRLIQEGETRNGTAYAMFGLIASAPFVEAAVRESTGDRLITVDGATGQPVMNADIVLEPRVVPPGLIDAGNAKASESSFLTQDAMPDIAPLAEANDALLLRIREIEAEEGYTPPYDDTNPLTLF